MSIPALLLVALAFYLHRAVKGPAVANTPATLPDDDGDSPMGHWRGAAFALVVGFVFLVGGAHVAVVGALGLAKAWGLSDSLAGIVLLALGTSLPELVVTVVSIIKKQSDVAVGNIVGSTLFNLLGILGVTALVMPLPVPEPMLTVHLWVMLGAIGAGALFVRTGWHLSRVEGGVLLAAYPIYLFVVIQA